MMMDCGVWMNYPFDRAVNMIYGHVGCVREPKGTWWVPSIMLIGPVEAVCMAIWQGMGTCPALVSMESCGLVWKVGGVYCSNCMQIWLGYGILAGYGACGAWN